MSPPLRWHVLATHVPPGGSLGGVVRYTTELVRALAARDDVEVHAVTTAPAAETLAELVGDRGRVRTLPAAATPLLSVVERYAPLPLTGADVVHGVKHLVPRLAPRGALRVLTVHDMLLLDRPDDFGRGKRALLPRPYRASIAGAGLVVCVSAATRDRLVARAPGAAPRAAVVPLATSPALRAQPPAPLPSLAGRRYALVVGDQSPRKNIATLVAAWPAVRAAVPDAVLAVAGPPNWGRTEVGGLWDRLVDQGAVVPLGHVSDAQLRWAYEHAVATLAPSLAEGFGLPAAEALDLGSPLLVSDDPALVEVAAGRALAVVPATDVAGWSRAVAAAFTDDTSADGAAPDASRAPAATPRTWDDVAEETVRAVVDARAAASSR